MSRPTAVGVNPETLWCFHAGYRRAALCAVFTLRYCYCHAVAYVGQAT